MQIVRTLCLFLTPSERKCSRLCRSESSFKYESGLFVQGLLKVSILRRVLFLCGFRTFNMYVLFAHTICMKIYTHIHVWRNLSFFPWVLDARAYACDYFNVTIPSQSFYDPTISFVVYHLESFLFFKVW